MVDKAFLPNITKYVFEIVLIVGSIGVSAYQFLSSDAIGAVGTLTIFIAAGSRIAPAALRIQQWALQLKGNIAASIPTFELARELQGVEPISETTQSVKLKHEGFDAAVSLKNIVYRYHSKDKFRIETSILEIKKGQLVAIVGPSGSGKSTLADLLLGILTPDSGTIEISSLAPMSAITNWPGAISYVPQSVHLIAGSIRENVTRGYNSNEVPEEQIYKALDVAQLTEFVRELPNGLDYVLDENASNLSGGQRQRLGIARAVLTNPKLLVMDEATSALDAETEKSISETFNKLKGDTTVVIIAHRLATVRNADLVIYMENGRTLSVGTFEEVKQQVPNFDRQAKLLGL
jgi:ABC-type multidrug transport system fused ATPase/permease subunit